MSRSVDSRFITNQGLKNLQDRMKELISASKELKFLVGFFYFSGIRELYESLKDKNDIIIKVLVGLEVDKFLHRLMEHGNFNKTCTDEQHTNNFFESMKKALSSEELDNSELYSQIPYFLKLIEDGRLIIRKTRDPNHSKLYLFKIQQGHDLIRDMVFITGSSNLTSAGLHRQGEFNVEISDYGCKEAEIFFDELWADAVKITENIEKRNQLIELVNTETMVAPVMPFEAYALLLKSYLDANAMEEVSLESLKERMKKMGYIPYQYQIDAIKLALSIIKEYKGVIIADVVGLGKTIIACAVARLLKERGIVICPPGIMGDRGKKEYGWFKYLEDFGLYEWEVYSSGKLQDALDLINKSDDINTVIVDEAHKYRNQNTESYELLSHICHNKKVILLTATPFSNTPNDIFSLIKLFTVPARSNLSLTNNLDLEFLDYKRTFNELSDIRKYHNSTDAEKNKKAQKLYRILFGSDTIDLEKVKERTKFLASVIRNKIQPVLIRRNRIDLQNDPDYQQEIKELSRVEPPRELFFELTKEQSQFYDKVVGCYFSEKGQFSGAIYRPYLYEEPINPAEELDDVYDEDENNHQTKGTKNKKSEKAQKHREQLSQKNLYDFMRRLLVKRFESSFGAFYQSVKNFIEIHEKILSFIQKTDKYVLNRKLIEKIYDADPEDIEEELKKFIENLEKINKPDPRLSKIYDLKTFHFRNEFIGDIKKDINLFHEIKNEVEKLQLSQNDPKSQELAQRIPNIINEKETADPLRKIVIFTEYIDTAKYLTKRLQSLLPAKLQNRILTIYGNLSEERYEKILENFDARYEQNKQKDDYDILITTDRLSEGFNLNRAGAVINYDIPWNPTRVIQRVGRINRISKMVFKKLYIYNFFPTEKGADYVRSREIAQHKMFLIHNTIGEDARIFDPDEEPTASQLYTKIMTSPDELETESLYTKIKRNYYEIEKNHPEVIKKIQQLPSRVKSAKTFHEYNLVVFIRKGRSIFTRYASFDNNPIELDFEEGLDYAKCPFGEPLLPLDMFSWDRYKKLSTLENTDLLKQTPLWEGATNNLQYILKNLPPELNSYRKFLHMLLEDLRYYRSLSDYTMRKLRNLKLDTSTQYKEFKETVDPLRKGLGDDYLAQIQKEKDTPPEIIIAIENRPNNKADEEENNSGTK